MQISGGTLEMNEHEILGLGGSSYWLMQPVYEDKGQLILLDRELTLLKIKANPTDPILFQTYYCAECADFISIGGLFPTASIQHQEHRWAWLPSADEYAPGQTANLIAKWLAKTDLTPARRRWLSEVPTRNAMNWAWVCNENEYLDWAEFLDTYLDELVESWLDALNGKDSPLLAAHTIWQSGRPEHIRFRWSEDSKL